MGLTPTPPATAAPGETLLEFPDNRLLIDLCGPHDRHLARIEEALSVHILETIIELSAKLGLGIVAEGVETETQRDYLASHGVDYQQGYLFARPMPAQQFLEALATRPGASRLPQAAPPEIIGG